MKAAGMAVGWLLTLVAAYVAGGVMGDGAGERGDAREPGVDDPAEVIRLREQVEDLAAELETKAAPRQRVDGASLVRRGDAGTADVRVAPDAVAAVAPADGAAATFSLAGAANGAEASAEFMEFAEAQLLRGEEGHAAIMDALGNIWTDREKIQTLFGDEAQAVRELYPWVRFLVHHEDEVVGLSDYVFRTMADDPMTFQNIPDDDVLEIFTEGVAVLLPGVVDEETLATFRGYAQKMLDTPESEQPKAVAGNRRRIERLLAKFWAEPIAPLEAFERLAAGDVPPAEVARLLRLVPVEMLSDLDVGALIAPLLAAGNHEALRVLMTDTGKRIETWKTDQAVLDGMAAGNVQAWFLRSYFSALGHDEWTDVRPFFDRAIGAGDKSLVAAVTALARYMQADMRPDAAYVADLIARFPLDDAVVAQLKQVYGLGD